MRRILASGIVTGLLIVGATTALAGSAKERLDNDLISFAEKTGGGGTNGPGGGGISGVACASTQSSQPSSFAGNALLDCDSVGPHNETTLAVNPTNGANIVAASHTYLYNLDKQSALALLRIFTEAYVSKDGGQTWTNVHPPHGSYRFLTDPALAFDADGHLYWSNVASHDSVGGAFSDVSVIVERSDDGGISWTDPVTVAKGNGTISNGGSNVLFNDKDWIAVDRGASPYRGSVYITWARQQYRKDVQTESPIFFVRSRDGGVTWTAGAEISGASALCSGQGASGPVTRCDQNDAGFSSPIVGPDGTIYVAFLNHQAQGSSLRDQVLLVSSTDGGDHWSAPRRIVDLIHDGSGDYPTNFRGDATLTRRATKHSPLSAVVVRWSRARKRYERQGTLVDEATLARAEAECLGDAEAREAQRQRAAERREAVDREYVAWGTAAVVGVASLAVVMGKVILRKVPLQLVHQIAAALFTVFAIIATIAAIGG